MKLLRKVKKGALTGKTVLLRIDLNVEPGAPLDSYRLEAALPTLRLLLDRGAKVVILSHRGRPQIPNNKFQITNKFQIPNLKKLTLEPFISVFSKKLGEKIEFVSTPDPKQAKQKIDVSKKNIFLLENLRFWEGEEENSALFAKQLATLGDIYVNDAFAVSHRANASVAAITRFLPSYAGLLLEREIEHLSRVMKNPSHPVTIVVGGAKICDKIGVIEYFWNETDAVLMGGGPANTFFAAEGIPMGASLVDSASFPFVKKYRDKGKIMLPVDSEIAVLPGGDKVLDIGEISARWFADIIKDSKTVVWNGPMGLFEKKGFEKGTVVIWKAIAKKCQNPNDKCRVVVGGGETVASLASLNKRTQHVIRKSLVIGHKLFVSTGGGAMLEFLSGKKLPGIVALESESR